MRRARRVLKLESHLANPVANHGQYGRTEYWKGRIAAALNQPRDAREHFRLALEKYPLSWYSILAYSRLRESDPKLAIRWFNRAKEGTPSNALDLKRESTSVTPTLAEELARLGLAKPASRALAIDAGADPSELWRAALTLDQAGAYSMSHTIMRRKLQGFRSVFPHGDNRDLWTVGFPAPYGQLIANNSKKTGVEPNLIWAIMREESSFNAGVESHANAVGLMQLILPTARDMRRKGERRISRQSLTDPDWNVTLGSRYLAHVAKVTGGVSQVVPAGYNAGAGRLKKWLRARGGLPLDLFVELIPYEEARGYTKRVMSSYGVYRYLYGDSQGQPPYFSQATMRP